MRRIGPWELHEQVGEGGIATVWRGRDESGREAALKILRDQRLSDPDVRSRVRQEIRILALLDHPNIAALLDHGELLEAHVRSVEPLRRLWLALEWVAGSDLSELVSRRGALEQELVVRVGGQVASALAAAHTQGVVHRDLTPRNVLVTPQWEAKLVDFGLAKVLDQAASALGQRTNPTGLGAIVGSAPWLSPEQVEGRAVDARTDIHALGAVLYFLATGQRPFGGRNVLEVLDGVLAAVRPRVNTGGAVVSEALDALISTCLARDPDARPQSAGEVARLLQSLN